MEVPATQITSIALYRYLCHNIIGTEKHVNTIRMMHNVRDNLHSLKNFTTITSGSYGEGIEMRGSDLDVMYVSMDVEICEDTNIYFKPDTTYFIIEAEDTKPGFSQLRLVHMANDDLNFVEYCDEIGGDYYFSNDKFKKQFLDGYFMSIHGPCLTDRFELLDIAFSFHSNSWITPAKQWIARSNNPWPEFDVKKSIINHGVLFVPIGDKGSTNEELEWRMSFSVAEKLLIFGFAHTQLLCYALMKILLKDVIAIDLDCKELLCSYYLKTIMFWISEELPQSIWKPKNLISCFMRCYRRLLYCVDYSFCPHYFIPENNLFENKIKGRAREILLDKLYILNTYGWKCILLSDQISNFLELAYLLPREPSLLNVDIRKQLFPLNMWVADCLFTNTDFKAEEGIRPILSIESSKIKSIYSYYTSKFSFRSQSLLQSNDLYGNKSTYSQYKTCVSTLLQSTRHDAVSGWLLLASFFYKTKHYNTALNILQYSLLKCSPEKLYVRSELSPSQYELLNLNVFKNMTIFQIWKFLLMNLIAFPRNSMLIPSEIQIEAKGRLAKIPPVVYAHCLRFLCHYHLNNTRKYRDSLRDLQLTIEQDYFIPCDCWKAASYNILGTSFQLVKDIESARHSFMQSMLLLPDPNINNAFQKFSLLD